MSIAKTEYLKSNELLNDQKSKAILKAKQNAEKMVAPLSQKVGEVEVIYISDLETESITSQMQGKAAGVQIRGLFSIYEGRAQEDFIIDFLMHKVS